MCPHATTRAHMRPQSTTASSIRAVLRPPCSRGRLRPQDVGHWKGAEGSPTPHKLEEGGGQSPPAQAEQGEEAEPGLSPLLRRRCSRGLTRKD